MSHELTIIVPVYNEEESLPAFKKKMDAFIGISSRNTIVLFVNDGSSDNSMQIIGEMNSTDPRYHYISLDRNHGLSTAIKAGIDACKTKLVGYIDADLQTDPVDFEKFFQYFPDYEMVNGIRSQRKDTIVKKMSSKIANTFRRRMINDNITDTCCPLKIIKTEYAKRIPFFTGMHRFIPALIQFQGGRVKQLSVSHFPRYAGTAKYHLWNRLIGPFFDTLAFRWMRNRAILYKVTRKG